MEERFRLGRVLAQSLSIWGRKLPFLLTITLLVHVPRIAVLESMPRWMSRPPTADQLRADTAEWFWRATLVSAVRLLLNGALRDLTMAFVIIAVDMRLRGRRPVFGESVRALLGRLLPVLAVSLCLGVLTAGACFGLALLGLWMAREGWGPGSTALLFFTVRWTGLILSLLLSPFLVAVPAAALEGSFRALRRSVRLTRGHRLVTAAAALLLYALNWGFDRLTLLAGVRGLPRLASHGVWWAEELVVVSFTAVFAAVAYHALRVEKEGTGASDLGEVFA